VFLGHAIAPLELSLGQTSRVGSPRKRDGASVRARVRTKMLTGVQRKVGHHRNGNSLPPLAARLVEELQRVKVFVHFLRGSKIKEVILEGSHHHPSSIWLRTTIGRVLYRLPMTTQVRRHFEKWVEIKRPKFGLLVAKDQNLVF